MKKWKVILSSQAKAEMRGIHSYIAYTLLVSEAAKKQVQRIIEGIESIVNMPLKCSLYENEPWHSRGLRKFSVNNYVVFYLPNETTKEVVLFHVFYGGRHISEILKEE